jgi:hypothetical protein
MKRNIFRHIGIALLLISIAGGFTACNSCSKKQKKSEPQISKVEIEAKVKEYIYPLPSSFEVTKMLNDIEAGYIFDITSSAEKASTYLTETKKALNLGVYAADLSYATTYNQRNETQRFVNAAEILIKELDLTSAFSGNVQEQVEQNIDNKEKLVESITDVFHNSFSYLNNQGNSEVSYLILAGTWLEGLYLTTHVSENNFQNPKIIEAILFQKPPLVELQKRMEQFKESELSKEVYSYVVEINNILALEDDTAITKKQIDLLTTKLEIIREAITK